MRKKITVIIEDDDNNGNGNFWTNPPQPFKKINDTNYDEIQPVIKPGTYYWEKQTNKTNNGWVNGVDICANCPNNPSNPNGSNYGGFCCCAIPSMYGPNRITC